MTSAAGLAASPAFLAVCAAVWGALAGAFLPRAAHRFAVPAGEPWSTVCPEGDPVRGWVGVRACPAGHGPSPYPYALGTALVCALLAAATGPRPELFVWLLLAPPGVLLFHTDLRVQRLPDPLTLTTAPSPPRSSASRRCTPNTREAGRAPCSARWPSRAASRSSSSSAPRASASAT